MFDLSEFAMTLELRSLDKLLADLPELAKISIAKYSVACDVLRRRFSGESPLAQHQLRASGLEIADAIADQAVAQRIRDIFDLEAG